MTVYVSSSVIVKLDEYVEFLMRTCHYNIEEAETRRWEVEHQLNQHCNPILMKAGSSGTIKFKSVLQRQEIERFVNNHSQLMKIIKRRKGNKGNTQWNVDYIVSDGGDVFITAIKCYNTFSECLTYQGLQQLINECVDKCLKKYLNKSSFLFENYSSKHYSSQISDISKQFITFKEMVDRLGMYYQMWQGYNIIISLKPFFDKESKIQPKYRRNKDFYIRINYDNKKSGNVVTGFYNPNKLHKTDFQIELTVPSQAKYEDIFHSLEHEVTHLIDDLIKECKGIRSNVFPTIQMENAHLPKYARMLLYILWTSTEFNAWQTNYQQVCGSKDLLDVMMKYLNEANESSNEQEWENIQYFVYNKTKKEKILRLKPFAFKNYFIKTTFKLLKKMVRKYY